VIRTVLSLGLACLASVVMPAHATSWPELEFVAEHPVEGMRGGNLSGLALCQGHLWAVSDRDDDQIYRLDSRASTWQAEARTFQAPPAPDSGLPWGMRSSTWAAAYLRGGALDFEGISCDQQGTAYVVSEAQAGVLRVPPSGDVEWLRIDPAMVRQARASGMLLHFNALFEGLAVNPAGDRLWLAAERERRGLVALQRQQAVWTCVEGCVLFSEAGKAPPPAQTGRTRPIPRDFSDLAWFEGKLFTLERNAYQVCRRAPDSGDVERCWSFAEGGLAEGRRYDEPYGLAEALVIDRQGAWIGLDNNNARRADGETRPIVWRFAAPKGGWSVAP
jgi:hypothetical protein